jgi:REP element-mobilizing transposase RayT
MKAIKNIRLRNYDYSINGYYFVTVLTNYRRPYLVQDLYELVNIAIQELNELEGVKVDYAVVMSNHIHLILILSDCPLELGEIVRRLKAKTSQKAGLKLWQPNYYEHVIRHDLALSRIRQYIINNPHVEQIEFRNFYDSNRSHCKG